MRVIARPKITEFKLKHANASSQLDAWYHDVKQKEVNWTKPSDISETYKNASFVGDNVVIFDIKGGKYRLVVRVEYTLHLIFIRWFGTHAEYNRIDVNQV